MKRRNIIEKENLSLYYLAKYTSKELLIEELVFTKGGNKSYYLNKYNNHPFRFRLKIVLTKLFYAIIFGVMPVIPLLTYLELINLFMNSSASIESIFFMGGLLFSLYFALQFLNFFIMGMLDATMIISGKIFEWLETLPISRKKLLKIVYLTLFRSYDIPIIVLFFSFPLVILIGSQSLILFLICFGISFVNLVFSFSILILIGERINRILDINEIGSKKTLLIRLINIFSYIIIIFSSYAIIQWFFSSIGIMYDLFVASDYHSIINLILSLIPYPFSSSFLISLFIAPNQASPQLWVSTLIGFALFSIITYWISKKAFKAIERISISKLKAINVIGNFKAINKDNGVDVRITTSFIAYLRRDLYIISRDIKAFISIIMPITLSFIFITIIGIKNIGIISFTDGGFLLNWIRILIFSPIISGLLVHAIMNLDASGGSIIDTLPIVPREQAKSKLFLIFIFQTCATLLPSLMYLTNPNFIAIIANFLFTLPFNWLILLIIFLLRIELFGRKKKKNYVLGYYNPQNRIFKWTMTISVPFGLLIWVFSIFLQLYYFQDLNNMVTSFWIFLIVGFLIVFIFYDTLLPSYKKESFLFVKKVEQKPTIFSRNNKLSIVSLVIIDYVSLFLFFFFISFFWIWVDPYDYYYVRQQDFSYLFKVIVIFGVPCILLIFIWFYFVPKCLGLPNGRQSLSQYLDCSGLSWLKLILNKKSLKTIIFVISSISVLYIVTSLTKLQGSSNLFNININIMLWTSYLIYIFFQELLYRGIILTILMKKSSPKKAIIQQAVIFLVSKFILPYLLIISSSPQYIDIDQLLYYLVFEFIYIFVSGLLLGFAFYKRRSILPGLVSLFIISLFYPLPFLFVFPIMYPVYG
jgi:membrane protease YdiL (CAAX protease family)